MAKAKITWTLEALADLESIGDFIAQDSVLRAVAWIDLLYKSVDHLELWPLSGAVCPEYPASRQVVSNGYRIIYRPSESEVFIDIAIITIISPGQDANQIRWEDL